MNVIKRDGKIVPFDINKIYIAIEKADRATTLKEQEGIQDFDSIKEKIRTYFFERSELENIEVEKIQDIVERFLMEEGAFDTAKNYILYRQERTNIRGNTTDNSILELLSGDSEYWNSENSNKDSVVVTTQRDYLAGIASTDISRRKLLPKDVCRAHDLGIIHQHDIDYMAQNALTNCCLINLEDMLYNGTVVNGIKIDPQHKLLTGMTVATQIITAVASSQYGGTSITLTHLAPLVRMSYNRYLKKYKDRGEKDDIAEVCAKEDILEEIRDAVQTFNYQINSMSTTNGQAPFISVFMYLGETEDYKEELALLIEEFLKQRIKGMKNKKGIYITQAFPKLLYVLEEDNIHEESPYWYLTELAAECTAKRMVPDYISEKKMKEYKIDKTGKGACYGCMGCRSFLTPDRTTENYAKALNYDPNKGKYWGRFNMGVTTINLVDLALSSQKDEKRFWELFEERTELCHKGLRARIDRLEKVTSDVAPILWQDGAFARLNQHEPIHELLHHGYSTASLGFAGLYECVKYMTGHSHSDGGIGEEFGLKVMQALNDKCNQWKTEEDIDYSLYGSPIESTTYKFAKTLKERFGKDIFIKLDGHDRNYITNSYHIPVFEEIDIFNKLEIESKFQKLSPGGAISYGECSNLTNNIPAVLEVLKFIYNHIMYAELNTKSDYCQECGYDGEILIDNDMKWYCPNCGNRDQSKMNVARRTCGYIGNHFWNYGRTQEIKERVVHLGGNE